MRIGLIGIPGSGKSDLAAELSEKLDALVIDNYVAEVEEGSDLACGIAGSYVANMAVALNRLGKERKALRDGGVENVITCGTMVETALYAATEAALIKTSASYKRVSAFMELLGALFNDTWGYDQLFYLRPLEEPSESLKAFDEAIPAALEAYKIAVIELPNENRLEKALDALKASV